MIDPTPTIHATHGISTGVLMRMYRGGHAVAPHLKQLRSLAYHAEPRISFSVHWYVDYSPAPSIPQRCTIRYGHNNAAAERMGLVAVTWSCP